jgi:hypothetical protein
MLKTVTIVVLVVLGALLVLEASFSLEWRMVHDAPILMYAAYGMTHFGYVPYVDFLDMNAPGTHYFSVLVGQLFGYGDVAFRLADLSMLALLLFLTWMTMRRFGRRAGLSGAILFGLLYLAGGQDMSLQREFVFLVPVAGAVLAASSRGIPGTWRWLVAGVLFGVAATIKPTSLIGLPAVVAFGIADARGSEDGVRAWIRAPVFGAIGVLLPVALTALHLASLGALDDFVSMARNYWPLYTELSRTHVVVSGAERAGYLLGEWVDLGGRTVWLAPALLGSVFVFAGSKRGSRERRLLLLLVALTASYCLYPVLGGKFWTYHWFPFSYYAVLLASLALATPVRWKRLAWVPVAALVVAAALGVRPPGVLIGQLKGYEWAHPKAERADRIAGYLREELRPGDTVQPLDWTGGALHAMLLAEARLATPFIYDFHFCHHVSTEYVRALRERFVSALEADPPRFIIRTETMRPYVSGEDTERTFRAVDDFVSRNYTTAHAGFGYRVYERKETRAGLGGTDDDTGGASPERGGADAGLGGAEPERADDGAADTPDAPRSNPGLDVKRPSG